MKDWLKRWLPWLFLFVVTLSWDASPSQVAGYRVYWSTSPVVLDSRSFITVGNVLTHTFGNTYRPENGKCYYAVTAYDAAKNESVYSNIVNSEQCPVGVSNFRFEMR